VGSKSSVLFLCPAQNKEEAVEIHRPVTSSTTPDSANVTKSVVHPVQSTVVAVSQRAQEVKKVDCELKLQYTRLHVYFTI
jgi:hypothetical protein